MATVLLSHALRYDLDVTSPDLLRRNSETYPDLKTKKRQRTLQHGRRNWSGRRDSNPRPQPWQGCALPLSYTRITPRLFLGLREYFVCQNGRRLATKSEYFGY